MIQHTEDVQNTKDEPISLETHVPDFNALMEWLKRRTVKKLSE